MRGFIKLQRRILEHPWLNDRPEYRLAWEDMLLTADYKTGRTVLRDIPAKRFFSRAGWCRFVARLVEDKMITDVQTENLGKRVGKVQSALITKYHEYHAVSETAPAREGQAPPEELETAQGTGTAPEQHRNSTVASETPQTPPNETHSETQVEQPIYKDYKELKEVKEERSSDRPPKDSFEVVQKIVGTKSAAWLRDRRSFDFALAVATWGEKLPELWQKALADPPRKPRDQPIFRFQDACEGMLDLSPPAENAGFSNSSGRGVKKSASDAIAEKRRRDREEWAKLGVVIDG